MSHTQYDRYRRQAAAGSCLPNFTENFDERDSAARDIARARAQLTDRILD
ncbi:hypothetical protein ACKTEK_02625 [Tepidamorphus sp. 3E244]